MIVVNGLIQKQVGLITRQRTTKDGTEQSVIDFVIMSSDLIEHLEYVHVDDKWVHVLTKFWKSKNGKEKYKVGSRREVNSLRYLILSVNTPKRPFTKLPMTTMFLRKYLNQRNH